MRIKKIIAASLAAVLTVTLCGGGVLALDTKTITLNGITYEAYDINGDGTAEGATVIKAASGITELNIPAAVSARRVPVKTIAADVFKDRSELTSVTIADSVVTIGAHAFSGCENLTEVTLSSSLTKIADYAFAACESLSAVTLPDSLKTIGVNAFAGTALKEAVVPASVTSMGTNVFYSCVNLESAKIKSSLEEIPDGTFMWCYKLKSVEIPKTATRIGKNAFESCKVLSGISIPENLETIDNFAFVNCSFESAVVLPASMKKIGRQAFPQHTGGVKLLSTGCVIYDAADTFNENCTLFGFDSSTLKDYAVKYERQFESLDEIKFEKHDNDGDGKDDCAYVTGCRSDITKVVIPGEYDGLPVTAIKEGAFENRTDIKTVTLPEGLKVIAARAFSGCTSLKEINIPESVITILDDAFKNCSSLTKISIPNKDCTIVGEDTIRALTTIYCHCGSAAYKYAKEYGKNYICFTGKYDYLTYLPYDSDDDYEPDCALIKGCDDGVTDVVIPETIEGLPVKLERYAFSGCEDIESVTFPENFKIISSYAFKDCKFLKKVTLPESVELIDSHAFQNCKSLESITIPNKNCRISFDSDTLPEKTVIHAHIFSEAYDYADIFNRDFVPFDEDEILAYDLYDYDDDEKYDCVVITDCYSRIKEVLIPEKIEGLPVTCIDSYAFENHTNIEKVTIPETVSVIYYKAFSGCTSLKEITIPESVELIDDDTFRDCTSLETITILNRDCEIDSYSSYTIPENTVIKGYKGSTAEAFAKEKGRKFEAIYEEPPVTTAPVTTTKPVTTTTTVKPATTTTNAGTTTSSKPTTTTTKAVTTTSSKPSTTTTKAVTTTSSKPTTTTTKAVTTTSSTPTTTTTKAVTTTSSKPTTTTTKAVTTTSSNPTTTTTKSGTTTSSKPSTTATAPTTTTTAIPDGDLYGDINLDGAVNIADVVKLNKYLLNSDENPMTLRELANADCMRDNQVDASDSTIIMNYVAMVVNYEVLGAK